MTIIFKNIIKPLIYKLEVLKNKIYFNYVLNIINHLS